MRASWLGTLVGLLLLGALLWIGVRLVSGASLEQVLAAVSAFVVLTGIYVAVVGFDRRGPG